MLKRITYFVLSVFTIVLAGVSDTFAQNFAGHNWYFGNSTRGIEFSRSTNLPSLINNKFALNLGGTAVATDQINGNLLFYTDGTRVFNASHIQMPNGGGLLGDATQNQPVAIAKIPDVENQYYIFHRDAGGTLRVTVVDMKLFGGAVFPSPALGDVATVKNDAAIGLTGRSEGMITIPHADGDHFWLVTHASGTASYTSTLIGDAGAFTSTTQTPGGLITSVANFSYHELTGRLAVSPKEAGRNVEILNFDNATGAITFGSDVPNSATTSVNTGQAIYDTEWSNSGQYLYISRHGDPAPPAAIQADVIQFDTRDTTTTLASALPQPNTIFRSYGLQLAPDSLMYHLYQATNGGPFFVGAFSNTDTAASVVGYVQQAFPGNVNFNARQFASFAPADTVGFTLTFTTAGTCSNAPTSFFPTVQPAADSLVWDFGDGSSPVTSWSPVYTYTAGGTFPVTVTAYLNGQPSTPLTTQNVTITDFQLQITLVQDTTACSCELPLPKAVPPPPLCDQFTVTAEIEGGTPGSMQWFGPPSLGVQTTTTLTPQEAGYYYLVVRDGTNPQCYAYAGVNIKEYGIMDQRANIWHFGQNAGIDFNPLFDNPPTAAVPIVGPLDTPEGCAVISDRNGQVIFSTDGQRIYDKNGTEITPAPMPPGLGGEPGATQSALIIPVPDDETLFYIFTTQEVQGANTYELRYSLFDLKENGGTGGLIESNILLFTKSTERITSNGNWLIAHEYGNNSFRAYRISQQGISSPVISDIGSDHSFSVAEQGQGYMEIGGNSMLAVALSTPGVSNFLEIFDFVDSSGVVTNFRPVNLKINTGQVYGLEFSGGKIFASITTAGNTPIVEVFFDAQNIPHTVRQQPPMTIAGEAGAIQVGPDGTIYVAVNNSTSLATIQPNADSLVVSTFTQNGFALAGGTQSKLGLPNFIQVIADPVQGPAITVTGTCEDDSVSFSATPRDSSIEEYFWTIRVAGGGATLTTSEDQSFNFFFPDPGNYEAVLRLHNRCDEDTTLTQTFTIFAKPAIPGGPFTICTTSLQLDANPTNAPGLTYLWDTGETTQTITVDRAGQFLVTVTNASGCASDGEFAVADNRPDINLGPDETICTGIDPAPVLDAQNPALGNTYQWTINGVPANTTQTQDVAVGVAGIFTYEVTVTTPGSFGCTAVASKTYTINPTPVFTFDPTDPACGSNDGNIDITFPATPVGALFSYSIGGPTVVTDTDQAAGSTASTGPVLAAGAYTMDVSNQVTGCTSRQTTALSNAAFTASFVRQNACNPVNLSVTTTAPAGFSYVVVDATTGVQVATGSFAVATPSFNIPNINAGTYMLTITDAGAGACSFTTPATAVTQDPVASITGSSYDGCNVNGIVTVSVTGPPGDYTWTVPAPGTITAGQGTSSIQVENASQGAQTYSVHVDNVAGFCPTDVEVPVVVNNNVVADWTQSTACADQVTLSATPSGSYTYQWFREGVAIPGGQQIVVQPQSENGALYSVQLTNTVTGCVFTSDNNKPVQIAGLLTVQANFPNPIPCENTQFTITTTVNQSAANLTFEWFYEGTTISGQSGSSLTDNRAGDYTVEVTFSTCTVPADITIIPAPTDPGQLSDNALICPDLANPDPDTRQALLDAGPGFQSYEWFKDEVSLGVTTQTFTATEEGLYSVDLVNTFGCPSTDETQVDVECEPRIVAPSAFRPASDVEVSGDFTNRAFKVLTFFIADEDFQVFIFNRWGEMIFQSNERLFTWNGGYNNTGQLLPAGTYSYVVRYKSTYRPEDGIKEKRGGVVLVR